MVGRNQTSPGYLVTPAYFLPLCVIQQVFTEHLLHVRHCIWGYGHGEDRCDPVTPEPTFCLEFACSFIYSFIHSLTNPPELGFSVAGLAPAAVDIAVNPANLLLEELIFWQGPCGQQRHKQSQCPVALTTLAEA